MASCVSCSAYGSLRTNRSVIDVYRVQSRTVAPQSTGTLGKACAHEASSYFTVNETRAIVIEIVKPYHGSYKYSQANPGDPCPTLSSMRDAERGCLQCVYFAVAVFSYSNSYTGCNIVDVVQYQHHISNILSEHSEACPATLAIERL